MIEIEHFHFLFQLKYIIEIKFLLPITVGILSTSHNINPILRNHNTIFQNFVHHILINYITKLKTMNFVDYSR